MVVLAGLGAGALTLHSPASHTFTIPGTPAQNAIAAGLPLLHAVLGIGISLPARGHPVHPAQLLHLICTARRFCGPAAVRATSQRDPDAHGEFEEP